MRWCVFCGSAPGIDSRFAADAAAFGVSLAQHNIELVYGGGRTGLMGIIADAVMGAGGRVIGIIPQALEDREIAHHGLTDLHIVGTMHERKAMMAQLSDGFVALPGGFGTYEEFCEAVTWDAVAHTRKAVRSCESARLFTTPWSPCSIGAKTPDSSAR